MATYGTIPLPARFKVDRIAAPEPKKSDLPVGLLRIIIVVAEVGAAVALTVATGGTAAPATSAIITALVGQVAIGLAGATAQLGVSIAADNVTGMGVAFDYASAFIPLVQGLGASAKLSKRLGKAGAQGVFSNAAETANDALSTARVSARIAKKNVLERQLSKQKVSLGKRFTKDAKSGINDLGSFLNTQKGSVRQQFAINQTTIIARDGLGDGIKLTWKQTKALQKAYKFSTENSNIRKALVDLSLDPSLATALTTDGATKIVNRTAVKMKELATKYNLTIKELTDGFEQVQNTFKAIEAIPLVKKFSKNRFLAEVSEIATKEAPESLQTFFKETYKSVVSSRNGYKLASARTQSLLEISRFSSQLSEIGKEKFDLLLSGIQYGAYRQKDKIDNLIEGVLDGLDNSDLNVITSFMRDQSSFTRVNDLFTPFTNEANASRIKRFIRYTGTKSFNDNVVQRIQFIDPNDLGRAVPERAYQWAKGKLRTSDAQKKFTKRFTKKSLQKATANAKSAIQVVINKSPNIEKAFENSGGFLIGGPGARRSYLMGYKVISGAGNQNTVMLYFNRFNTKTNAMPDGKDPVLVLATDNDLKSLRNEGVSYYWRVGKRKGWRVSDGGRKSKKVGFGKVSGDLSLFLGFLPIPAIRNLISIVSNVTQNIGSMIEGDYFNEYLPSLTRAFTRTSITRTLRLTARVYLPIKLTNKFGASAANFIGRETQRITLTVANNFLGQNENGYFKFKDGSSVRGNRTTLQNVGRSLAIKALPAATRSIALRGNVPFVTKGYLKGYNKKYNAAVKAGTKLPVRLDRGARVNAALGRQLVNSKRYLSQGFSRPLSAFDPFGRGRVRRLTKIKFR